MCGIAGYVKISQESSDETLIQAFIKSILHRGPDEQSFFHQQGVCLINDRLSIIDISSGQQPFYSDDNQIVVVQNGEIYNFVELKEALMNEGVLFKTKSDTEVILKAYECYAEQCFTRFNGMFAIAIYDRRRNCVFLGRDRLGVKPLYLYQTLDGLYFSSEIKTFLSIPSFNSELNSQSIHEYLKYNYVPIPETIYTHVTHVKPGHYYQIETQTAAITEHMYWSIPNVSVTPAPSETEIVDRLDDLLCHAVSIRLRSDVPIGAFLSGGLDSSLVCAIAKKKFNADLSTFSIGFKEKEFDESQYAKHVSDYLGLQNSCHIMQSDILELWNTTTWFNDQPHGDPSFMPTYILSQVASQHFKLVLTGDGADEAFAGYTKYLKATTLSFSDYFDAISLIQDDSIYNTLYTESFKSKIQEKGPFERFLNTIQEVSLKDRINQALYFDTRQLLPGNNLIKPDKMAMAHSLEIRSPFLDYRMFEFSQSLPGELKLAHQETKYLLKKLAVRYLPESIVYRKKQMFSVPMGEWFKTKLKDPISDILSSTTLQSRHIFNPSTLQILLQEHLSEKKDHTRLLRAIVNLELWFRIFYETAR